MSGDNQQGQHGPFSKDGEQGHHGSSYPGKKGQKDQQGTAYPRDKEYKIHDKDDEIPASKRPQAPDS
jgi:hypothetical protein